MFNMLNSNFWPTKQFNLQYWLELFATTMHSLYCLILFWIGVWVIASKKKICFFKLLDCFLHVLVTAVHRKFILCIRTGIWQLFIACSVHWWRLLLQVFINFPFINLQWSSVPFKFLFRTWYKNLLNLKKNDEWLVYNSENSIKVC